MLKTSSGSAAPLIVPLPGDTTIIEDLTCFDLGVEVGIVFEFDTEWSSIEY